MNYWSGSGIVVAAISLIFLVFGLLFKIIRPASKALFLIGVTGFVVCTYLAGGFHKGIPANISAALSAFSVLLVVYSCWPFKSVRKQT